MLDWIKNYVQENFDDQELLDELNTWDNVHKPLFTDVETMSKKIHIPFGQFVLNKPPKGNKILTELRRLPIETVNQLSLKLKDLINHLEYLESWLESYLKNEGFLVDDLD